MMLVAVWVALVGYAAVYAGMNTLAGIGKGKQPYSVFDALSSCAPPRVRPASADSSAPSPDPQLLADSSDVPGLSVA